MKDFKKVLSSFESAAKSVGRDPKVLPGVTGLPEADAREVISSFKLGVISEAAWAGVPIDWDNYNQLKYYPYWDMRKKVSSGVGLRFDGYTFDGVLSSVGSRRVFPSREITEYVAKQHFQLYVDTLVINNK